MMASDFLNTIALVLTVLLVSLAYAVRIFLRGRAHFDRVERQGGSVLLGKGMMEMAYWSMQPFARFLAFLHVSPNMISWTSLVLGGVAGVCLAYGHFGYPAVFGTYSAFMDTLDGLVARLTGQASDAGEVLDACVARYVEFFFLGGLVIYYREVPVLQVIALGALMGSFMVSYSTAKAEALNVAPPPGIMRRPERAFYLILGAALSPIPMPWLNELIPLPIEAGFPMVIAMFLVGLLTNISAIERFYTVALAIRVREAEALEKVEALESHVETAVDSEPLIGSGEHLAFPGKARNSDFRS